MLSRARVYTPGLKTYTTPVIMATENEIDAELARLYRISTHLLWCNHSHLPLRARVTPLTEEEEAQLAAVVDELSLPARLRQAMRHKWWLGGAMLAAVAPVWGGVAVGAAAVGCGALAVAGLARSESALPA